MGCGWVRTFMGHCQPVFRKLTFSILGSDMVSTIKKIGLLFDSDILDDVSLEMPNTI